MPNPATGDYGGRARYAPKRPASQSMTSVAMLGRMFAGYERTEQVLIGGANWLVENPPRWDVGPKGAGEWMFYYWYYGTLVMFQMGGQWWKQWNAAMREMLISKQIESRDTRTDGSWEPIKDGAKGGRAYSTALCCLCLEVYYRYLPMYK
jgi:hypothetical protein